MFEHGAAVQRALDAFVQWLDRYGELSRDHQTFFAGPVGGTAKRLYYERPWLGLPAVAPLIVCEALLPWARRWCHHDTRFPIADAHYAMGFAFLYETTGERPHLDRAVHFLETLKATRCEGFQDYCWGYPFDWVTRNGIIKSNMPLITSTPYVWEAFKSVQELAPAHEWRAVMASIVRHARTDIRDFPKSERSSACSYTPYDSGGVINAAAYRAFLLTSAAAFFGDDEHWRVAERNLAFVLENQNADGSWPYAVDGVRDFVDHFHTCFVMKALAKIHGLTGHRGCLDALACGLDYYFANLFGEDGLPRPFARAPRLTVYKRELYDCAECINLCLLLRDRFPACGPRVETVVAAVLRDWVKPDGSFRSRKLYLGWDNVPMHRWGQSQMFRSLAFYLHEAESPATTGLSAAVPQGPSS